jgi:hypothetical protein
VPTGRVETADEVIINAFRYQIEGPVATTSASQYPGKTVIGDTTKDSLQRASVVAWKDWRGGIGKEIMESVEDTNRAWYSNLNLRHVGHLRLPPLATATASSGVAGVFKVGFIGELADEIYVGFSTTVKKLNYGTDSWGSSLHALPAAATDAITCRIGGTVYLVIACTTHYVRTSDGSTFEDENDDIKYLTCWDDRIWGIDKTGQLKWADSLTIGGTPTWTNDAQLPLPDDYVTDLFVADDAEGEPVIYAATKTGLWGHRGPTNTFIQTKVRMPFHDDAGKGVEVWYDSVYYPAGLGTYEYVLRGDDSAVDAIGLDRDDGLPAAKRGKVIQHIGTHQQLLALIDATQAAAEEFTVFDSEMVLSGGEVANADVGVSLIAGWDKKGWQIVWESDPNTQSIDYAYVSGAYDGYRLWWAQNELIHYMDLPVDVLNPNETSDYRFQDGTLDHETPWFDAGQTEVTKTALRLKVETSDCSSTETVVVQYATNFSTSYTTLGTITSDGVTTYDFPDSTDPTGTDFRQIRFRLRLDRGTDITLSPDVRSLALEYRKKVDPLWAHEVTVKISDDGYGGKSPEEMFLNIRNAAETTTKVEFSFRNRDTNTFNYYVDVVYVSGEEQTGDDWTGKHKLLLVEV